MPYTPTSLAEIKRDPITVSIGYRYGLQVSQVMSSDAVLLVDGIEITAEALAAIVRPDPARWVRFERVPSSLDGRDIIIVHTVGSE